MGRKLLIDFDAGIDGASALMLALSRTDVEILAITCCHGNVSVDKVCCDALRVLKACDREEVPVFRGTDRALLGYQRDVSQSHGNDGMGDVSWSEPVDTGRIQSEHAVMAILRLANEHPGEITLVQLGPMTNIALALRLDPDLGTKLKEVFAMGGNIDGRGDLSSTAEFSFYADPEAADIIIGGLHTKLTLVPWETCVDLQSRVPWVQYDEWTSQTSHKAQFFKQITKYWMNKIKARHQPGFLACDLFAMCVALDSSCVVDKEDVFASVELHGQLTRGQMNVDWRGQLGVKPNVTIIKDFCEMRVMKIVSEML